MTVNLQKLESAKTIKDLHAAGITEEMLVGVAKTTYKQRVKSLDRGKQDRAILKAVKDGTVKVVDGKIVLPTAGK